MKNPCLALTSILALATASANAADLSPPMSPRRRPVRQSQLPPLCQTAPSFLASARAPTGRISVTSTSTRSELRTSSRMACCRLPAALKGRPIFTWKTGSRSRRRSRAATSNASGRAIGCGERNCRTIIWERLRPTPTPLSPNSAHYTTIANPTPVPFSGPAYVRAAKTSLLQEIDLIPFLGHAFGQSYVYAGGGPTLSQTRTQLNGLVGFALVDGGIVDQSGAPQDFSSSSWLFGGAAMVGVTYFLTPTWFVDLNYTYALDGRPHREFCEPIHRSQFDERGNIGRQLRLDGRRRNGSALTINKAF